MSTAQPYEVTVVGAGAVGMAGALSFAKAGFSTCLVGTYAPRSDGRTVALLGGSVRLLQDLRAWPHLAPSTSPLRVMRIVDDTGGLFAVPPVAFNAGEIGLDAFGHNIETGALLDGLSKAVASAPGLTWIPENVARASFTDRPLLTLENGLEIAPTLAVAADGRRSLLREAAGIAARDWSYLQTALTTILSHDLDHEDASTEFHTRFGPFTLVPMAGRRSSLVWVTHPRHVARLAALDDTALAGAIERQARSMLGAMRIDGPRGLARIAGMSVVRMQAPGLALIGEAAHVLPPIGAQGLNLGLRDVADLCDIVKAARAASEPIGTAATLRRYEQARSRDVGLRSFAVDMLNRSLTAHLLPADLLRGIGLAALAGIGPLRRAVMRSGLGDKPDPRRPSLRAGTGWRGSARS